MGQFIRYIFVGVLCTLIFIAAGNLSALFLPPLAATCIAYLCSGSAGYLLQMKVTFRTKARHKQMSWKFVTVTLLIFCYGEIITYLGTLADFRYAAVNFFIAATNPFFSFPLQKFWVYKKEKNIDTLTSYDYDKFDCYKGMEWFMSRIKLICSSIGNFAKKKPLAFVLIVVLILVAFLGGTYKSLHITSEPTFCELCHPEQGSGPLAEYDSWSKNIHAASGVECLDCHGKFGSHPGAVGYMITKMGGLYDVAMQVILSDAKKLKLLTEYSQDVNHVKPEYCLHCHSDKGNSDNRGKRFMSFAGFTMRKLDSVKNPAFRETYGLTNLLDDPVTHGAEPDHAKHVVDNGVACASCHVKVTHSGEYKSPISMQTCFDCHEKERAVGKNPAGTEDCAKCHVTQINMQAGDALSKLGISSVEDTPWVMLDDTSCDSCHTYFAERPTKDTCIQCHDEGYADLMQEIQSGFNNKISKATAFVRTNLPNRAKLGAKQLAILNEYEDVYNVLVSDGSKGVHNQDYAEAVFNHLDSLEEEYGK